MNTNDPPSDPNDGPQGNPSAPEQKDEQPTGKVEGFEPIKLEDLGMTQAQMEEFAEGCRKWLGGEIDQDADEDFDPSRN